MVTYHYPRKLARISSTGTLTTYCLCGGILDYIYHHWFKCRDCGRWRSL